MTKITFPSGNIYNDDDPIAEAAARAAAKARLTADPTIDDKPADGRTLTGLTTIKDGKHVEINPA